MSQEHSVILAHLIQSRCERTVGFDILTFVSTDEKGAFQEEVRSYRQLWENGQRLASWMRSQGMEKGDKFGIIMQNHPEFVDLMVAPRSWAPCLYPLTHAPAATS